MPHDAQVRPRRAMALASLVASPRCLPKTFPQRLPQASTSRSWVRNDSEQITQIFEIVFAGGLAGYRASAR
jgi:hypothetical protein